LDEERLAKSQTLSILFDRDYPASIAECLSGVKGYDIGFMVMDLAEWNGLFNG